MSYFVYPGQLPPSTLSVCWVMFERGHGTFVLNSFWENFIRGAFLPIVVVFQSRLAGGLDVAG